MNTLPSIRPIVPVKISLELFAKLASSPTCTFELKYDGFRAFAYFTEKNCVFWSRHGNILRFPRLAESVATAVSEKTEDAILDGEICSLDNEGRPVRPRGQRELVYFAFDILWFNGEDLRWKPLERRKRILKKLVGRKKRAFFQLALATEKANVLLREVVKHNLEGVIVKQRDNTYASTTKWYKILNPKYVRKK